MGLNLDIIFSKIDAFFFFPASCSLTFLFCLFVQIAFSLFFSLVIAFISDGLSTVPDKASILSSDASFRREFNEIVRYIVTSLCTDDY